jgi:hypothetical protein
MAFPPVIFLGGDRAYAQGFINGKSRDEEVESLKCSAGNLIAWWVTANTARPSFRGNDNTPLSLTLSPKGEGKKLFGGLRHKPPNPPYI